jgi:hypothetical protein
MPPYWSACSMNSKANRIEEDMQDVQDEEEFLPSLSCISCTSFPVLFFLIQTNF